MHTNDCPGPKAAPQICATCGKVHVEGGSWTNHNFVALPPEHLPPQAVGDEVDASQASQLAEQRPWHPTEDQVRAIHRASHIQEAVNYRGFDEERGAKAYDDRQRWMNDDAATLMRQDRREALREDDWEIAYTQSHLMQAVKLGILAPNNATEQSEGIQ